MGVLAFRQLYTSSQLSRHVIGHDHEISVAAHDGTNYRVT